MGPKSALKYIRELGSLDKIVEHLREKCARSFRRPRALTAPRRRQADRDEANAAAEEGGKKKKVGGVQVPEHWPWEDAKRLFLKPDVQPAAELELEWKNPDVDGLVDFLVTEKGFKCVRPFCYRDAADLTARSEERVRKGAEKLTKYLNAKQQGRLDGFFKVTSKPSAKEDGDKPAKGKGKGKEDAKGKKRKVRAKRSVPRSGPCC